MTGTHSPHSSHSAPAMAPEFSRTVVLDELPHDEFVLAVEANADERAGLARRFGLLDLDRLAADVRIRPMIAGRRLRVHGWLTARVVQRCVVTLEPVTSDIREPFEVVFERLPEGRTAAEAEVTIEEDDVEPLAGPVLDVGELVASELALDLDPYPRAPGAVLDVPAEETPAGAERVNPFEVLAGRKRNG